MWRGSLDHLPYGSFRSRRTQRSEWRLGARWGDRVVDLVELARSGRLPAECDAPNLDRLLAASPEVWAEVRIGLEDIDPETTLAGSDVELRLPFTVGDYVDFYSSEAHAMNAGRIFRPDAEPLVPNWRHLPVGYHGRSGTILVDGSPIHRPSGQRLEGATPVFGPTGSLDIELELGVVVGGVTEPGTPVPIRNVDRHLFGVVLLNDWSARDIQAWESRPLGPFLGKSFATTIGAWVTPISAMQPYRVTGPVQEPAPLPYLLTDQPWTLDLDLTVSLCSTEMRRGGLDPVVITRTSARNLYWSMAQQLAHLTVNGASVRPGDLFASGTISGREPSTWGSLLERTWNGRDPIDLPDGSRRTFLEDGDEVVLAGQTPDGRVRLAPVSGTVVPTPSAF